MRQFPVQRVVPWRGVFRAALIKVVEWANSIVWREFIATICSPLDDLDETLGCLQFTWEHRRWSSMFWYFTVIFGFLVYRGLRVYLRYHRFCLLISMYFEQAFELLAMWCCCIVVLEQIVQTVLGSVVVWKSCRVVALFLRLVLTLVNLCHGWSTFWSDCFLLCTGL